MIGRSKNNRQKLKRPVCSFWLILAAIAGFSMRSGDTRFLDISPVVVSPTIDYQRKLLCRVDPSKSPWGELSHKDMINHIKDFFHIWRKSPDRNNEGGAGFFHYFALYVIIQELKPKAIVESGAHQGIGTWMLRQAAGPEAKIIVLSPGKQKQMSYVDNGNSLYLTHKDFVDFSKTTQKQWVDWVGGFENLQRTLIFFDDHQAGLKRLMEGKELGFKHFVFDDNYPPTHGDNFAMKQICSGIKLWKYFGVTDVIYRDNFNQVQRHLGPQEFQAFQSLFWQNVAVYSEFPPVWDGPSRFDPANGTIIPKIREPALFTPEELIALGLDEQFLPWDKESSKYTFILYAQANSNP